MNTRVKHIGHFKPHSVLGNEVRCVLLFFLYFLLTLCPARAQVDAEVVTLMGRNALSVDDYLTAIKYFNQAIEAKPFLSRPYYYRAYAKFTLEDYSGALSDCSRSIELNPFITEVYQLRGLCRIHQDDFDGAIADYTRVLRDLPEDQGALYNRALCQLQLKHYAEADSDLNTILRLWPKYQRTYLVKAQSLLEQKDTVGGLRWIDRLLAINPKEAQAWSFKGRYALNRGEYPQADSCLSKAIALQPRNFDNLLARAQARHAMDRFGLAIADYDAVIALVPEHFVAHYNRGLLRSFVGDLNRAIDDFDFVIRKEPDNVLAIYNRAQLRQQTGNYRGAIADFTRLLRTYPNFTYGYLARAECRRKVGDVKGALNDESYVARRNLDLAFGRNTHIRAKRVRTRSEHALEQYHALIEERTDTARNVFGTLYGKVQNEKVNSDLLPMFALAFRPVYTRGYHSVAFMPEVAAMKHANTPSRQFCLTAEPDADALRDSEADSRQAERYAAVMRPIERLLISSALAATRYNYSDALNAANQAIQADSTSVAALLQCAYVLGRQAASGTLTEKDALAYRQLATSRLERAAALAHDNAVVAYNQGCLLAEMNQTSRAEAAFTRAVTLDNRMPEAYYNRALIRRALGRNDEAAADFSRAGQLGFYQAYAQLKQLRE